MLFLAWVSTKPVSPSECIFVPHIRFVASPGSSSPLLCLLRRCPLCTWGRFTKNIGNPPFTLLSSWFVAGGSTSLSALFILTFSFSLFGDSLLVSHGTVPYSLIILIGRFIFVWIATCGGSVLLWHKFHRQSVEGYENVGSPQPGYQPTFPVEDTSKGNDYDNL